MNSMSRHFMRQGRSKRDSSAYPVFDSGRKPGRKRQGLAKFPQLRPRVRRLRRRLYCFGGVLGVVRGQKNARSQRLDRSVDLSGGSFRHVVGAAILRACMIASTPEFQIQTARCPATRPPQNPDLSRRRGPHKPRRTAPDSRPYAHLHPSTSTRRTPRST